MRAIEVTKVIGSDSHPQIGQMEIINEMHAIKPAYVAVWM
jgi:hypothetical protein